MENTGMSFSSKPCARNEEIANRTPNETLDELERDGSDAW